MLAEIIFVDSVTTPDHCLPHLLDPPSVLITFLMVYGQLNKPSETRISSVQKLLPSVSQIPCKIVWLA